jgi:phosphatidylinositol-3-phosphatase
VRRSRIACLVFLAGLTAGGSACRRNAGAEGGKGQAARPEVVRVKSLPRPGHVVVVIEENKGYGQIIGNPQAPYINSLASRSVLFKRSYALTHPSQPNYLALFSGSMQGIADDSCPHDLSGANLASELRAADLDFAVFSESMPDQGYTGCRRGTYVRKHNPAVNWQRRGRFPPSWNLPFRSFPRDFSKLPTVSFVIPNLDHDMHDGSITQGDAWLRKNMGPYIRWAGRNNSLFILTWDEDDFTRANHIVTMFSGGVIRPGVSESRINHYSVLRTLEDMYGLAHLGETRFSHPVESVWKNAPKAAGTASAATAERSR